MTVKEIIKRFDLKYPVIDWRGSPSKNEVRQFLKKALNIQKKETISEMIKLSDTIESEYETEFNEWRAFKGFRNVMRDQLETL